MAPPTKITEETEPEVLPADFGEWDSGAPPTTLPDNFNDFDAGPKHPAPAQVAAPPPAVREPEPPPVRRRTPAYVEPEEVPEPPRQKRAKVAPAPKPRIEPEPEPEEERIEVNLFELLEAFRKVLGRVKPETFHQVVLEHISVEDKIQEILTLLERENRSMAFHRLFPEKASRRVVVITLLAILELVKMKRIRIFQLAPFETIRISPF